MFYTCSFIFLGLSCRTKVNEGTSEKINYVEKHYFTFYSLLFYKFHHVSLTSCASKYFPMMKIYFENEQRNFLILSIS